jgi:hypothetical protein
VSCSFLGCGKCLYPRQVINISRLLFRFFSIFIGYHTSYSWGLIVFISPRNKFKLNLKTTHNCLCNTLRSHSRNARPMRQPQLHLYTKIIHISSFGISYFGLRGDLGITRRRTRLHVPAALSNLAGPENRQQRPSCTYTRLAVQPHNLFIAHESLQQSTFTIVIISYKPLPAPGHRVILKIAAGQNLDASYPLQHVHYNSARTPRHNDFAATIQRTA